MTDDLEDALQVETLKSFDQLPLTFQEHLIKNRVPQDAYDIQTLYRYVRVNPRYKGNKEVNKDALSSELNIDVEEVEHLNALGHCFFRFPSHISISNSSFYKESVLYGIDLSSAATVIALDVHSHHHVLDLCCAPGAKLAMISDIMFMKNPNPTGTVTGVDISNSRLSICRTLCKRYQLKNVRLFLQDATKFNFLAPDATLPNVTLNIKEFPVEVQSSQDTIPKLPKKILKKRKRSNNTLENLFYCREWTIQSSSVHRYDRVLVDAQCTLDASVRHLLQHQKQGVIHSEQDDDGDVTKLQKRLIMNAFHLLKEDGYLVYSTCSFCASQNEDVVQWLLDHEPTASVVKIEFPSSWNLKVASGQLEHTLRFYPKHLGTSGMFIAKIKKEPLCK